MKLSSLKRITHWSGLSPSALWSLDLLVKAHGKKLDVISLWSPSGRNGIEQEPYDRAITGVLKQCPSLRCVPEFYASLLSRTDTLLASIRQRFLELDIFNPWPLPDLTSSPHPTLQYISLGLELIPYKERLPPLNYTALTSPMNELVRSISRKAFPRLQSLHLLSCDASAMTTSKGTKEAWGMLPGWIRWAEKDGGWAVKDGWGDVLTLEEWGCLDEEEREEDGRRGSISRAVVGPVRVGES